MARRKPKRRNIFFIPADQEDLTKFALLALTFISAARPAFAGPINSLCNTGVSDCATETPITTQGILDRNFTVTQVPSGTNPTAETFFESSYYCSGANPIGTDTASWITTDFAGSPSEAVGTYNYEEVLTTGNFSGTVPVAFSGNWATDNCGTLPGERRRWR